MHINEVRYGRTSHRHVFFTMNTFYKNFVNLMICFNFNGVGNIARCFSYTMPHSSPKYFIWLLFYDTKCERQFLSDWMSYDMIMNVCQNLLAS